jgi:hypothetical protein
MFVLKVEDRFMQSKQLIEILSKMHVERNILEEVGYMSQFNNS